MLASLQMMYKGYLKQGFSSALEIQVLSIQCCPTPPQRLYGLQENQEVDDIIDIQGERKRDALFRLLKILGVVCFLSTPN